MIWMNGTFNVIETVTRNDLEKKKRKSTLFSQFLVQYKRKLISEKIYKYFFYKKQRKRVIHLPFQLKSTKSVIIFSSVDCTFWLFGVLFNI